MAAVGTFVLCLAGCAVSIHENHPVLNAAQRDVIAAEILPMEITSASPKSRLSLLKSVREAALRKIVSPYHLHLR